MNCVIDISLAILFFKGAIHLNLHGISEKSLFFARREL